MKLFRTKSLDKELYLLYIICLSDFSKNIPSSSTVIGLSHVGLLGLKLPDELRLMGLPLKLCLSTGLQVLCCLSGP